MKKWTDFLAWLKIFLIKEDWIDEIEEWTGFLALPQMFKIKEKVWRNIGIRLKFYN